MEEIRKMFDKMIRNKIPIQAEIGEVISVDTDRKVCDVMPIGGESPIKAVRLQAEVMEEVGESKPFRGKMDIPKVGSYVIVSIVGNDKAEAFICLCTELDKSVEAGENDFRIEKDFKTAKMQVDSEIVFNGGNNAGLANVNPIKTAIDLLSNNMQVLFSAIQAAPIVPSDGGAAFKAALITATSVLQMPDTSQFEDKKIKH